MFDRPWNANCSENGFGSWQSSSTFLSICCSCLYMHIYLIFENWIVCVYLWPNDEAQMALLLFVHVRSVLDDPWKLSDTLFNWFLVFVFDSFFFFLNKINKNKRKKEITKISALMVVLTTASGLQGAQPLVNRAM